MLAVSKCGSCGGGSFKLQEQEVANARYKLMFIQCAKCNVPIGITEYYDSGSLLKAQEKEIQELKRQLSGIEYNLRQMFEMLRRI